LLELFKEILELNDFKVIGEAHNGEECIKKLENLKQTPEFVLLDHRMPHGDGLEVTKKLISKNPELKIILMSGDVSIEDEALNAGAAKFIKKPFSMKALFSTIYELSI
jgi:two-component system chemotaxis response regulator CheY